MHSEQIELQFRNIAVKSSPGKKMETNCEVKKSDLLKDEEIYNIETIATNIVIFRHFLLR